MSIHLSSQATGEFCPRRLRIYANRANIVDFAEADSIKPHLDVALREGESGIVEYNTRSGGRFANVHSLSLFFVSHHLTQLYLVCN